MEPTYKHGTMLFAKKYDLNIKNNDVVIIKKDNKIIIKRVIGLPGNSIIIKDGYIFVNDEKHDDFFIEDPGNVINEIILQDDEYYVLGDNRQESIDSRFAEIGIIKRQEIKGIII